MVRQANVVPHDAVKRTKYTVMLLTQLLPAGLGHTYEFAIGRHGSRHRRTSAIVDNETRALFQGVSISVRSECTPRLGRNSYIVAIVLYRNTALVRLNVV